MSYNLGRIEPDQRTGLYVEPNDEEPAAPPPRKVLRTAAAILVMALFAGGLWFAYVEGARHAGGTGDSNDVPLIRADTRPFKVKPAEPGGMQIPDRDMLIYGEGRPTVEHLLPPPEQPMARPAPPQASAPSAETAPVGATPTALPTAAALTAPATAPIASAGALPATPARLEQAAEPAAAPPIASAPTKTGGMRLQLGSVRSAGMARAEWDRIKRANADLLGNFSAVAVRTDLGDKGVYYRIQTVPVGDAAHADRICGELKQRHLGCFTVR